MWRAAKTKQNKNERRGLKKAGSEWWHKKKRNAARSKGKVRDADEGD